jgi:hypothetical protein
MAIDIEEDPFLDPWVGDSLYTKVKEVLALTHWQEKLVLV